MNVDGIVYPELAMSVNVDSPHNNEEQVTSKSIPDADIYPVDQNKSSLSSRAIVRCQNITDGDFKKLLIDGTYTNDVHYVVTGNVVFNKDNNLKYFPDNVTVEGDVDIYSCRNLTHMGDHITVKGTIIISFCENITHIGNGCNFCGAVDIVSCYKITCFGNNITIKGLASIYLCPLLIIRIEEIRNMQNLCINHTDIHIKEDIEEDDETISINENENGDDEAINDKQRIISIPCIDKKYLKDISISSSLEINGFNILTGLGERIFVGGHLILTGCSQVTSLPDWIMQLRRKISSGGQRTIDLVDANLSIELIKKLLLDFINVSSNNVQILLQDEPEFTTLDRAMKFWVDISTDHVEMPDLTALNSDQHQSLRLFLGNMVAVADYDNEETRSFLANRIINMLLVFKEMDEHSLINYITIIEQSLATCEDGVSFILDEIELYPMLLAAETKAYETNDPTSLREFGNKMMIIYEINKLNSIAIDEIKKDHIASHPMVSIDNAGGVEGIDEVVLHMHFRTKLYDMFGISDFTKSTFFSSNINLYDDFIERAFDVIKKTCANSATKEVFMSTWEPLKKYKRYENTPEFNSLSPLEVDQIDKCPIYFDASEKMVIIGGTHISFDALKKSYREYGKNPFTNISFEWSDVRRLIQRQVEVSDGPSPSKKDKQN
ncbi:MAG: hypothetical protein KAG53_10435 [Endozoicomonadaceae bacterium]|nr:hypothetical protein [Endozoicomonadaceae bacterium]